MASDRRLILAALLALGCKGPPPPAPPPGKVAPATESTLSSELRRLGRSLHGTVIVRSNVAGATVELDGKPVRLDDAELIDVLGPHEVVINAPGYEPQRSAVTVASEQRREVFLALERPTKRKGGNPLPAVPVGPVAAGQGSSGVGSAPPVVPHVPAGKDDAVDPFANK